MIDLHTHTNLSDGTYTPAQLIEEAVALKLEALAISDHDTLKGCDEAAPLAAAANLDFVPAIELSTHLEEGRKAGGRSVHVLGYFLLSPPSQDFRQWLKSVQEGRRDRNRRLVHKLQSLGLDITLEEVESLGRNLPGRPHFARILLDKGYVSSIQEAFDVYLEEGKRAYVEREEVSLAEGIRRIAEAGGMPSLAHPIRIANKSISELEQLIERLLKQGLRALEVYHSDHPRELVDQYLALCQRWGMAVTGGSDFHGDTKPGVKLGTGRNGNLSIPRSLLDQLRSSVRTRPCAAAL